MTTQRSLLILLALAVGAGALYLSIRSDPDASEKDVARTDAPTPERVEPAPPDETTEEPVVDPPREDDSEKVEKKDEEEEDPPETLLEKKDSGPEDPARDEPVLDPLIRDVTDPDNPRRKWQAVYELTGERTAAETAALAAYLTDNPIGEAEFHGEEFAHRNFIMDALREQTDARPRVVDAFTRVYEDPRQGDVMRGYALQHLTSIYIAPFDTPRQAQRTRILSTLRAALPEREEGTLAATALIGLHEIAQVDANAVSAAEVERQALELLADPTSGDLTRISALHVAGERNLSAAVPVARRFAADPEQDWVVRMASVWLLGEAGGDSTLLARLAEDHDENVRRAARMARSNKGEMK